MAKRMLVGMVTVTYNSAVVIDDFMKSALRQTYSDFLLFVVDNASSDDSIGRVSKYEDQRVVIIRNSSNVGVAAGNNIGIDAALSRKCAAVLFINNDTTFDEQLLEGLVKALDKHDCQIVVPKILFFDEPTKIWSAGGYFDRVRASAGHYGFNQADDGSFDEPCQVFYSPTCCMLVKAKVFEATGLMDANYFVYFDDTDFCRRASENGVRMYYDPAVRIFHKVSTLTGTESDFTTRFLTRNHVYYILKNYSKWTAPIYLVAYQAKIFIRFLAGRQSRKQFSLVQKAYFEGLALSSNRLMSGSKNKVTTNA